MTKPASPQTQPTVILFGESPIGKPRAGTFKGSDVGPARKAAAKLGLAIADVGDQQGRTLAAKLPAGRIHGHGDGVVPFVGKELFAQLQVWARPSTNGTNATKPSSTQSLASGPRLPTSWDDIKIGDLVLAQDTDPADGWWQATVVERDGDLFKLRWPRSERGRPFQKHRVTLGLICPSDKQQSVQSGSKKSSAEPSSAFPKDWAAIGVGQIVLAKEDGPCQQWWEAKTVKVDKDLFTLQWRDQPNLPSIVRPRAGLGLMHPTPKTR
jgi:hypothetical protein